MKEKLKSIRITPDKSLHFDENSTSHRFTPFKPSTVYITDVIEEGNCEH